MKRITTWNKSITMKSDKPSLLFADKSGNIMEYEPLAMVARSGDYLVPIDMDELIDIPEGSHLYILPDRHPVGLDKQTGEIVVLERNPYDPSQEAFAVAAFLSAAHTHTYLAAWERKTCTKVLPLFAYAAIGWNGGFVTTAIRVDQSRRQDPDTFDMSKVKQGIEIWRQEFPRNQLVEHLSHCALIYGCPAALNLFQGREEGPLPTSPRCNARCVGCISFQEGCDPPSPQQRIKFVPTPEEIAQIALKHIETVDDAVVSFGQGCEGEPLLAGEVIREAIKLIRQSTKKGTINLNSNASLPEKVAELADEGLDSLRISMNSARKKTYEAYFRPHYAFETLMQSAKEMKSRGKFVSVNLFVFPGVTDAPKEVEALKRFILEARIDMIQWRNLNIDPDQYLNALGQRLPSGSGIRRLIQEIHIKSGYFNPYLPKGM